jgi:site-specific recombinase XerD
VVEHLLHTQGVAGSNPAPRTTYSKENDRQLEICTEFAQNSARPADKRVKFPVTIRHRSSQVKIYGPAKNFNYYRLSYALAGKRRMQTFATYPEARAVAERTARELANGSQAAALTASQSRDALAALEQLRTHFEKTGRRISLLASVSAFCEADSKLNGKAWGEAVEGYLKTVANVTRKDIGKAVADFLAVESPRTKASNGERAQLSAKYAYNRKIQLEKFANTFPNTAICDLSKEHLDKFIGSLDDFSAKSRNHYRTAIRQFLQWAVRKDYLSATHRLFEADAMRPEHANTAEIHFYTPRELAALLEAADGTMRPLVAIGGLAGLRTAELLRLDWKDVWRVAGHIEVTAGKSKTRQRRLVEMCPALQAWLEHYRTLAAGPIWNGKADDDAYNLIMRDKERLLSMDEPLRFVFSHSALREGWDNPNVFQICTLREISTERERRQTIGRGLRLPVRENGERCFDPLINRLTVVASETFKEFAKKLQSEMEKDCGVNFEGRILNKRERRKGILNKQRLLDPDFQILWDKIKHKTRYAVKYSTSDLVARAAGELHGMPEIKSPFIRVEKGEVQIEKKGVTIEERAAQTIRPPEFRAPIPDILGYLQRETELTRSTLAGILIDSQRLPEVTKNPQQFLEHALAAIQKCLNDVMVSGIEYERIANAEWEMHRLESEELESYISRLLEVRNSIYDVVEFESKVEYDFATTLNDREDIKLFFKLPDWFKIETPLGTYNPDWAIVREESDHQNKLYLVRETKGTTQWLKIPEIQRKKIHCGEAHFKAVGLKDNEYAWVASAKDV